MRVEIVDVGHGHCAGAGVPWGNSLGGGCIGGGWRRALERACGLANGKAGLLPSPALGRRLHLVFEPAPVIPTLTISDRPMFEHYCEHVTLVFLQLDLNERTLEMPDLVGQRPFCRANRRASKT
jgi:hypothetical protein